jgi:hypothetical protein
MLFAADHLRGSPFDAAVSPAAACASLSVVSFVTVATVGVPSTFILQVKDSFRNILHCDLNDWVHFFGMEWIPGAYSTAGSLCSFTFSPSIATAGHANFYVGSGYALSQPVLLSVLTGRLDFTRSAVQISSLMTAGTYISFTLVLVDSADNAKQLQNLSRSVRLLFYDANQPLDKAQAELQPAFVPSSAPPTFHFTFTTSSRFSVCVMLLDALLARAPVGHCPFISMCQHQLYARQGLHYCHQWSSYPIFDWFARCVRQRGIFGLFSCVCVCVRVYCSSLLCRFRFDTIGF